MTRFAPQWIQADSYAASVDRRLIGALWPAARCSGGLISATTGMAVQMAPGQVAVPAANGTGSVLCTWDAPETVTLDPAPPSGTNRIDLVVCQVNSTDVGGPGPDEFVIVFVKGAEAATPTPPAVPANAVALARVAVNGGAAAIVPGNLTDTRPAPLAPPRIESRTVTYTTVGNVGTITFLRPFAAPPVVQLTGVDSSGGRNNWTWTVQPGSTTATSFQVIATLPGTGAQQGTFPVSYLAVEAST